MGNNLCGTELVSVLPLCKAPCKIGEQYAVIIVDRQNGTRNGCRCYDFRDATVSFHHPQGADCCSCIPEACGTEGRKGWALMFSGKLLGCAQAELSPDEFTFFHYSYKESLHISQREKEILTQCILSIKEETEWGIDRYSCRLITRKIGILLTYCKRFYDRQFLTRSEQCSCVQKKLESTVDEYIKDCHSAKADQKAKMYIASAMQMSEAYLSDYIQFTNGHTLSELMQKRQIALAEELIAGSDKPLADIARELGFRSLNYMNQLLAKVYGRNAIAWRGMA